MKGGLENLAQDYHEGNSWEQNRIHVYKNRRYSIKPHLNFTMRQKYFNRWSSVPQNNHEMRVPWKWQLP